MLVIIKKKILYLLEVKSRVISTIIMSMLDKLIFREHERNERMINEYMIQLESLPKGKLIPKLIKGKIYYYLYYREGKKVISKYIGKDENSLISINEQLIRRNQIEGIIKILKEEREKIKKLEVML